MNIKNFLPCGKFLLNKFPYLETDIPGIIQRAILAGSLDVIEWIMQDYIALIKSQEDSFLTHVYIMSHYLILIRRFRKY